MSIRVPHEHTLDISQGVTRVRIDKPFIYGDSQTHRFVFTINDGNAAAVLTGYTATLYAVRLADKVTVPNEGTIDGNVVTINNVQSDFLTRGRVDLLLTLSASGEQVTLFWGEGTCSGGITDTIADPAEIIPTLSELLAQISAMETATGEAVAAAETANDAAESADTAAGNAQDAADAITGITIDAETLETGEPATASAEFDAGDGHLSVSLGLPKGGTGTRGSLIYRGTAITGTSTTPAAYSTGITDAKPLDLYRYNGTDSANIGNIYECTLGGDAATALWAYAGNWRGSAGAGNVSFVDGVEPDGGGDVPLGAIRYNAEQPELTDAEKAQARTNIGAAADAEVVKNTAQELTDAQQTQARGNIGAAALTPTYASTEWAALTAADRAALYSSGVRLVAVGDVDGGWALVSLDDDGAVRDVAQRVLDASNPLPLASGGLGASCADEAAARDAIGAEKSWTLLWSGSWGATGSTPLTVSGLDNCDNWLFELYSGQAVAIPKRTTVCLHEHAITEEKLVIYTHRLEASGNALTLDLSLRWTTTTAGASVGIAYTGSRIVKIYGR